MPGKLFVGSVVSTIDTSHAPSGYEAMLFEKEDFKSRFGRYFNQSTDFVGVMNSDGAASNTYLESTTYYASGNIWVGIPGGSKGNKIRIGYLVFLAD